MTRQKVLIPLDATDLSRQIIPHVRRFLDPGQNEVVLLRVGQPPASVTTTAPDPGRAQWLPMMFELTRELELARNPVHRSQMWDTLLAHMQDEMRPDARYLEEEGYTVSTAVRFGDPATSIADFAKQEEISLVAMATRGHAGLNRLRSGSVMQALLQRLAIPLLIVCAAEVMDEAALEPAGRLNERLAARQPLRLALATDGSPFDGITTTFAGELAHVMGADLTQFVVVHPSEGTERAQAVVSRAAETLSEVSPLAASIPLVGYPDDVILQQLEQMPADILIVGSFRDRKSTHPSAIGVTTQRLLLNAPASLLLVKGQRPAFGRILVCATAGEELLAEIATRFARALGAELSLLHVRAQPGLTEERLDHVTYMDGVVGRLRDVGFEGNLRIRYGDVPSMILHEAREGNFDLIVVGSRTRAGYLLGSVANRVAKYADRPVLVVRTMLP
jgi:nucleotide-binding universal stress UspA family protein